MKISHHWLTKYLDLTQVPEEVGGWLTHIGLEVSHHTRYVPFPDALVVGEVLACAPHPNGDRLQIARVDIGEGTPQRIVCGAPNLAMGQKVLVAPVGCKLPLPTGGTLEIQARNIRGERSQGMICAASELGFQGDAEGIWVLDTDAAAGTKASEVLESPADTIYHIELTPNRNDACSHLGVARDLAALLRRKVKGPKNFTLIPQATLPIRALIKIPQEVPRYTGLVIEQVAVAPSPAWLQSALKSIAIQPINNIVDITNYITQDLGQPLHAFDYARIAQKKIIIRKLAAGTSFTTLDGVARKLTGEEIMICDPEKPLAMGGIMGGKESAIIAGTHSVFLESAYFNPVAITKAARHHRLHTEASYRFERGTDPDLPYTALQKAAQLITQIAGGVIASCPQDLYPEKILPHSIEITYDYIAQVLGSSIPENAVDEILHHLDIAIHKKEEGLLHLSVPPYRRDVTRPIDIVEEILRIYGYNHPDLAHAPAKSYPIPPAPSPTQSIKQHIQRFLPPHGFYEIKNTPFIPKEYHFALPKINPHKSVHLANPLHEGYTTLPQTLLFGGLRTLHYNLSRQEKTLKFFEIAHTYACLDDGIEEVEHLALWVMGNKKPLGWRTPGEPFTLPDLQALLMQFLDSLGFPPPPLTEVPTSGYAQATQLTLSQGAITCGAVAPAVLEMMHINGPVFFSQIPLSLLTHPPAIAYREISKYPHVTRDLSLALPQEVSYATLQKTLDTLRMPQVRKFFVLDTYQGKSVGTQKSYTLRFLLQSADGTLREETITAIMGKITALLEKNLKAHPRA